MTSSQPVATPNALVFTPDNKHCYTYSGEITVTNVKKTVLEFETNSEYIIAKWEMHYTDNGATPIIVLDDMAFFIAFNDITVIIYNASSSADAKQQEIELIIPPFTKVTISALNVSDASDHAVFGSITGKTYGMTDTGFQ